MTDLHVLLHAQGFEKKVVSIMQKGWSCASWGRGNLSHLRVPLKLEVNCLAALPRQLISPAVHVRAEHPLNCVTCKSGTASGTKSANFALQAWHVSRRMVSHATVYRRGRGRTYRESWLQLMSVKGSATQSHV